MLGTTLPNGTEPSGSTFYVDMDLGLAWDGLTATVARAKFSGGKGYPDTSKLEMFNVNSASRALSINTSSDTILKNVNLAACRLYAPRRTVNLVS